MEFHKDKSPLKDVSKYTGCVLCDVLLNSLTELKMGRFKHAKLSRRGYHGRGGKRRGRGVVVERTKLMYSCHLMSFKRDKTINVWLSKVQIVLVFNGQIEFCLYDNVKQTMPLFF